MSLPNENDRKVRIHSLAPMESEGCFMVLEEVEGTRLLPILTAVPEAQALALRVSGFAPPRPMTHDLLVSLLQATGWSVARIVVSELKDDTFYARIEIAKDGETRSVDARPSDALNVAVRTGAPIFVAASVFEKSELVLKPISKDEVARFKDQLDTADLSKLFEELERKPAPTEPAAPPPASDDARASDDADE